MRAVKIGLALLGAAAVLMAALACLAVAMDPANLGRLHALATQVENSLASASGFRPLLGLVGGLLLLGLAAAAWGSINQRRYERIVVLRNPLGEVQVSLTALEDLGRLVRAEVAGVKDLKLRIRASRRGIRADARVVLQGDVDVAQVSEAVQASVRRRLQQVLGPDQDVRPKVMVSKLLPGNPEPDELAPRARMRRPPRP